MLIHFECPYLGSTVELSQERIDHIQHRHGHTRPELEAEIRMTLAEPALVRRSDHNPQTRLNSIAPLYSPTSALESWYLLKSWCADGLRMPLGRT